MSSEPAHSSVPTWKPDVFSLYQRLLPASLRRSGWRWMWKYRRAIRRLPFTPSLDYGHGWIGGRRSNGQRFIFRDWLRTSAPDPAFLPLTALVNRRI